MWQPIETAPKDGSWILLEGEMRGGDTSTVKVGRWEPVTEKIGSQNLEYAWRCFEGEASNWSDDGEADPDWNWYPDGRVHHWQPLPTLG